MKTPVFDALSKEWQSGIEEDLQILLGNHPDKSELPAAALNLIAGHSSGGDYLNEYFYLKGLAEKVLKEINAA